MIAIDNYYSKGGLDVAIGDGGTDASSASAARANLGIVNGKLVQRQISQSGSLFTIAPFGDILDDTVPQISEGSQFAAVSITPVSLSNKLRISLFTTFGNSGGSSDVLALFRSGVSSALATVGIVETTGTQMQTACLVHELTVPTLTAQTYSVRFIINVFTGYINGVAASRKFGGTAATILTVEEIAPN